MFEVALKLHFLFLDKRYTISKMTKVMFFEKRKSFSSPKVVLFTYENWAFDELRIVNKLIFFYLQKMRQVQMDLSSDGIHTKTSIYCTEIVSWQMSPDQVADRKLL
jgi:hypothetical protein